MNITTDEGIENFTAELAAEDEAIGYWEVINARSSWSQSYGAHGAGIGSVKILRTVRYAGREWLEVIRMNSVILIGRLTRDPEVRYTAGTQMAIATFDLAVDRPQRQGQEKQADFPRITVFGRQAETCEKYLRKGRLVCVDGRLQTGSYKNKNGETVYTTDVVADRVEFLSTGRQSTGDHLKDAVYDSVDRHANDAPENFEEINEEVPF